MTWTNLNNTAVRRKISHSFITYEETEALKLLVSIQVLSKDLPRLRFLGGSERAALSEKGRKPVVPRTSLCPTFQHCVRVRWLSLLVVQHVSPVPTFPVHPLLTGRQLPGVTAPPPWLYMGLPGSFTIILTATVTNLSVRFPPHSPRKPLFERKAKIKYGFIFRSWKWTHLCWPLILTSLAHHFTNTNLWSFEYVEIYTHAVPWDVMPPECPFILVHPLGTKSESEHYEKIDRQPFYEIIFKRKMSAKHLSDLKTKTPPVCVSYISDRSAKDIFYISIKYILHMCM